MIYTVSVSDMKISTKSEDEIITHALGSCLGISVFDYRSNIGGLLHFQLPISNNCNGSENPLMYAETAIPMFLKKFEYLGGSLKTAIIKAAGGATISENGKDFFEIGKKNVLMLKKVLWKYNLCLDNSDFGGMYYRTMKLFLDTGLVILKNHILGEWKI